MTPAVLWLALMAPINAYPVPGVAVSYAPIVHNYADANLVPRWVAQRLHAAESSTGVQLEAVKWVKVRGRWTKRVMSHGDFMISTVYEREHVARAGLRWEDYRWRSPEHSARVGLAYLGYLLRRYGDLRLAVAAYNCGPARLESARALPGETILYLRKVFYE